MYFWLLLQIYQWNLWLVLWSSRTSENRVTHSSLIWSDVKILQKFNEKVYDFTPRVNAVRSIQNNGDIHWPTTRWNRNDYKCYKKVFGKLLTKQNDMSFYSEWLGRRPAEEKTLSWLQRRFLGRSIECHNSEPTKDHMSEKHTQCFTHLLPF